MESIWEIADPISSNDGSHKKRQKQSGSPLSVRPGVLGTAPPFDSTGIIDAIKDTIKEDDAMRVRVFLSLPVFLQGFLIDCL